MTEQGEIRQTSLAGKIFQSSYREYLPEMRLLFRGGKLSPKSGDWNNVLNHDLVQAAASEVITTVLEVPKHEASALFRTVLVHDWEKRHDIKPSHFRDEEWEKAQELAAQINYDKSIFEATHPGFHDRIIAGEATFLQELQYYLDDITKGEEIALLEDRIEEVAVRRPEFGDDFWTKELKAGKIVEQKLFDQLTAKGVVLESPSDIPLWLKKQLETKYGVLAKQEKREEVLELQVSTFSEKQSESGDRRNEDTFIVEENNNVLIAAVIDGGSALSSITTIEGVEQFSGLFVSQRAADYIKEHYGQTESAADLLVLANQHIASELRARGVDPETASPTVLPTASGVSIIRVDKKAQTVEVAQAGDTAVLLLWENGRVELACPVDTPKEDIKAIIQAREIAKEKKISLKEALKDKNIGGLFVLSRFNENSPDGNGTGALNGKKSLKTYISRSVWSLEGLERIIMLTDGLFPPQKEFSQEPDWDIIAKIVRESGLDGLARHVKKIKASDPTLDEYPRAKQYDDTTGISIKVN